MWKFAKMTVPADRKAELRHSAYERRIAGATKSVLFIHGIAGTPRHFDEMVEQVPADYSVYNLLLDGHGKGVEDFTQSSMKLWKAQVFEKVQELALSGERVLIVAHSMGTLFAIQMAAEYPDTVQKLFLLAVPLKIFVKPSAMLSAMRTACTRSPSNNPRLQAAKEKYGIQPDKRLWKYLPWTGKYFALFREIGRIRRNIPMLATPTIALQSKRDELVSRASIRYLQRCPFVRVHVLENSYHYYYDPQDYRWMLQQFSETCANF